MVKTMMNIEVNTINTLRVKIKGVLGLSVIDVRHRIFSSNTLDDIEIQNFPIG